ncbi:MAG: GIY-YIG nuclease family protein [Chloroflexi bacterium]|nr:GIY-YIG nuclease family protein [Chloroflexota bacterium]
MASNRTYFTYMMASPSRVIYIGVTGDLERRVWQHKNALSPGFTTRYGCAKLVWFDETSEVHEAIREEKHLKQWRRQWKIDLIERDNPQWRDLASEWGLTDPEASSG